MATIIIGAYMVRYPLGGMMSWVLQHLTGFKALGHRVYFVEQYVYPNSCYNPVSHCMSNDCSYGVKLVSKLLASVGLQDHWCYVDNEGNYYGMARNEIEDVFRTADCYIDLGTQNGWENESTQCRYRVLIDGEPGYSQIYYSNDEDLQRTYARYNHFYTNGYNVGRLNNIVPTTNITWKHMYSPVDADRFTFSPPGRNGAFTTVMNWQSHKPIEYNGQEYGQKDVEFKKFMQLPTQLNENFEVAVSGKHIPFDQLVNHKWKVVDGRVVTRTYESFCSYIENAKAEFSVCKNVFVALNTGWFSDKSAAFLAAGRPVILQDTGFSEHLPCGEGLYAIKNMDEAYNAVTSIAGNWLKHSKAAKEIAKEYLDVHVVLKNFMSQLNN